MRGGFSGLLLTIAAAGACGSSVKTLPCEQSIAQACPLAGDCVLTWEQAQSDAAFCALAAPAKPLHADCGAYHAVTLPYVDAATTYYYDVSSGMLVAIVTANGLSDGTTCTAGPTGGFTAPICAGAGSEPLARCLADGGTD